MSADAHFDRQTEAFVGHHAVLNMQGFALTLTATTTPAGPHAWAEVDGGSGGLVSVTAFNAVATVGQAGAAGGATRTYIGTGASVSASHVTMTATSSTEAKADVSYVGIGGFVGVSASQTTAEAGHDTEAIVGQDTTLTLTGNLSASANGTSKATPIISGPMRLSGRRVQANRPVAKNDAAISGARAWSWPLSLVYGESTRTATMSDSTSTKAVVRPHSARRSPAVMAPGRRARGR